MANVVTVQTLVDGPRNTVLKVVGVLDTSDVAQTVLVDPATLVGTDNTGAVKAATFRIKAIRYSIQDAIAVNLLWDATTPVLIESLVGRGFFDNHKFGGLQNNAGTGITGKILISTRGWTAGGVYSFNLELELVKVQSGLIAAVAGTPVQQGYSDYAGAVPLVS